MGYACRDLVGSGGITRVLYARELTTVENHVGCLALLAHAICGSFADFLTGLILESNQGRVPYKFSLA
jgi:hypothetical protein